MRPASMNLNLHRGEKEYAALSHTRPLGCVYTSHETPLWIYASGCACINDGTRRRHSNFRLRGPPSIPAHAHTTGYVPTLPSFVPDPELYEYNKRCKSTPNGRSIDRFQNPLSECQKAKSARPRKTLTKREREREREKI